MLVMVNHASPRIWDETREFASIPLTDGSRITADIIVPMAPSRIQLKSGLTYTLNFFSPAFI